jgi:hypothetical protein
MKPAILRIYINIFTIPVGSTLPVWFDTFLYTAESSKELIDWLIFVTDDYVRMGVPSNVKMIKLTRQDLYDRIGRLGISNPVELEAYGGIGVLLEYIIEHYSFSVVEFKPLWGMFLIFIQYSIKFYFMSISCKQDASSKTTCALTPTGPSQMLTCCWAEWIY